MRLPTNNQFRPSYAREDENQNTMRLLDLWPEHEDAPGRLALVERLGHCAELSGDLAEAARALEEAIEAHAAVPNAGALAPRARRLAAIYDLQEMPERSRAARELPAGAYEVKVAINESWAENYGAGGGALQVVNGFADGIVDRDGTIVISSPEAGSPFPLRFRSCT